MDPNWTQILTLALASIILWEVTENKLTVKVITPEISAQDKRMDLLLTETSLQLQAVADGCLNKGGE